jgi:hypothetical protein
MKEEEKKGKEEKNRVREGTKYVKETHLYFILEQATMPNGE